MMKGIILAGGLGTRLYPLTKVTNKHLLPVGKLPMIIHAINKLVVAGISNIIIVTGTEHMGATVNLLGSGRDYNCNLTYKVQDTPDGIAGALSLCKDFASGDNVVVLLSDNIFKDNIIDTINKFNSLKDVKSKCVLNIKKVSDPERFGVAYLDENKIIKIIEKPKNPKSNYCVTGIYAYSNDVFSIIPKLKKSQRGEYEITDINNFYVNNSSCFYNILKGWWTDAGTHESYRAANNLINDEQV